MHAEPRGILAKFVEYAVAIWIYQASAKLVVRILTNYSMR